MTSPAINKQLTTIPNSDSIPPILHKARNNIEIALDRALKALDTLYKDYTARQFLNAIFCIGINWSYDYPIAKIMAITALSLHIIFGYRYFQNKWQEEQNRINEYFRQIDEKNAAKATINDFILPINDCKTLEQVKSVHKLIRTKIKLIKSQFDENRLKRKFLPPFVSDNLSENDPETIEYFKEIFLLDIDSLLSDLDNQINNLNESIKTAKTNQSFSSIFESLILG